MEAQAKLSVCRPRCDLEPARPINGVPNFAHLTGSMNFTRQAPLSLFSTMSFVLNKQSGQAMKGLSAQESADVHECLTWGRQMDPTFGTPNNRHLEFFGTIFEAFLESTGPLLTSFETILPEGCPRVKIQYSRRDRRNLDGELPETLGRENIGVVLLDPQGMRAPMQYCPGIKKKKLHVISLWRRCPAKYLSLVPGKALKKYPK